MISINGIPLAFLFIINVCLQITFNNEFSFVFPKLQKLNEDMLVLMTIRITITKLEHIPLGDVVELAR